MDAAPGTKYRYNNTGMILLGAMLERIAGEPVPGYLGRRLFGPMGIRSAKWLKDGAGNAHGYMGLVINARDLAKLGQLVLEEGRWEGKQLVDAEWMRESTQRAAYPEVNGNLGLVWMRQGGEAGQPPLLIFHSGDGGNWLIVFPGLKVVAARLRDSSSADSIEFPQLVYQQFRKE
jgi:CubicO group peptidase (beta-lactamase class C family)